jgi:hypothetical protein
MSYPIRIAALSAACLLGFAGGAAAQPAPSNGVREACMTSMQTLCPTEVAAMDRPAIRACMMKNIDKATPECQAAVKAARAAAQSAAPATPATPH